MQIHDALLIIKPHHFATIRDNNPSGPPKLKISFESSKWKKEFPGEFSSFEKASKVIKKLGFRSYRIKESGKWVRKYFTPWWRVDETDRDWKLAYISRGKI